MVGIVAVINKLVWCTWEVVDAKNCTKCWGKNKCKILCHSIAKLCGERYTAKRRQHWSQPQPVQTNKFSLSFFCLFPRNENSASDAIYVLALRKKWTVAVYAAGMVHRARNHSINGKLRRCHCARWHVVAVSSIIPSFTHTKFEATKENKNLKLLSQR